MSIVLGVDGGGTKTHAAVADERKSLLGFGVSGPSNWEDAGVETAVAALTAAVREALSAAALRPERVDASMFGLAGIDFPSDVVAMKGVAGAIGFGEPNCVSGRSGLGAVRRRRERFRGIAGGARRGRGRYPRTRTAYRHDRSALCHGGNRRRPRGARRAAPQFGRVRVRIGARGRDVPLTEPDHARRARSHGQAVGAIRVRGHVGGATRRGRRAAGPGGGGRDRGCGVSRSARGGVHRRAQPQATRDAAPGSDQSNP